MNKYRFVLVEPEYEANLGASARLLCNFGQKQMHIVNPDCHIGFTAMMHAKHAKKILEKARIYKCVEDAIKGCKMVVGTSGIKVRNRTTVRHPLSIKKFSEHIEDCAVDGEIAILFGREGIGLNEHEIDLCDLLITIPTDAKYPILNLTHAMGIVLYELCTREKKVRGAKKRADVNEYMYLKKLVSQKISSSKNIKNSKKMQMAIKRVIARAMPDELEVRSFISLLKKTE
jgi:TrmH family RNA methyltransferase